MTTNYHIGGVDRANQLRASYETHQRCLRSWWLIFFWTLDIGIINAYCIAKMAYRQQGIKGITHLDFRIALYGELFKQGSEESLQRKGRHSSVQPSDKDHYEVERIHPRKWCHFCAVRVQKAKARGHIVPKQFHTVYSCKACKIPLYRPDVRSCWTDFHTPRLPLGEKDVNCL
jgi:hypothetical protein